MKDEIKKFFEGEVLDDEETLVLYSHDASLLEVRPKLVVFPKHTKDISNLVKWVEQNKIKDPTLSLTARAAGTCMSGGPINESIIMDFTRYVNRIISVKRLPISTITPKFRGSTPVSVTGEAKVMPGCFYRDFEVETLKQGLLLPCYTASKSINAVGGMVGNNSAGELTLRYGKTEDYVKELKVVFADGNEYIVRPISRRELYNKITQVDFEGQIYKKIFELIKDHESLIAAARPEVSKNSSGYNIWNVWTRGATEAEDMFDITQLIVGSQGTLGIVTEITWRLVDEIETSKLFVIFMNDLTRLGSLVDEILPTQPISIESYDDKTFGLAMRFFGEFVKAKGIMGLLKFGYSFLPEFWMTLTGGVPKLILLVEYAGKNEEETNQKCLDLQSRIQHFNFKTRITVSKEEAKKYWDMRRDSFTLLRKHSEGRRTAPFIDDIIVRPEFLPEFLPKLNLIFKEYPELIYTIAGHAGNGNFHVIPLMDFNDPKTIPSIFEISDRVYDLVIQYQGSITAEHNDGIIRTPYLEKMFGSEVCQIFKEIKSIFDPTYFFNPNKKVGTTKEYLKAHIIQPEKNTAHSS